MSKLLKSNNRKYRVNIDDLTANQKKFVDELLASDLFSPTEAARKAGYKNPGARGAALLKHPLISAALGKAMRERQERCQLRADDVLSLLRDVLYFNPLHYFLPSDDGGWVIQDPRSLPDHVGRLIEELEVKVIPFPDGTEKKVFKVKMISKTAALSLALKHVGVEKHEVHHSFDWDALYASFLEDSQSEPNVLEVIDVPSTRVE